MEIQRRGELISLRRMLVEGVEEAEEGQWNAVEASRIVHIQSCTTASNERFWLRLRADEFSQCIEGGNTKRRLCSMKIFLFLSHLADRRQGEYSRGRWRTRKVFVDNTKSVLFNGHGGNAESNDRPSINQVNSSDLTHL
jgi:hypothetical protein